MYHRTQWIPRLQGSVGPRHFLVNSLLFHSAHRLLRTLVPKKRDPQNVADNYDRERRALASRLDQTDWTSYTEFSTDLIDYYVVDDIMRWGALREPRRLLLQRLVDVVRTRVRPGQTVVEFGSGDGRNLLYLKRLFPEVHFVGLELSRASVEVSFQAARKFGVDGVNFLQANVCEPLPALALQSEVGLVYSSFALEQMPRIFKGALENMLSLQPAAICLFEPVPELWGTGLRATVARLRSRAIDRLHHLPEVLAQVLTSHSAYRIAKMERSGLAINPHTEMCQVLILREPASTAAS